MNVLVKLAKSAGVDITPVDYQVVVPVHPCLLMIEAEGMPQLVQQHAVIEAVQLITTPH